jgi:NAD(P)-dependent dehydrogenase (short-subunit alcohol dehydrogenase family)
MLTKTRVNAVAPGPVDTEQFRKECQENPEQLYLDAQATYVKAIPGIAVCCLLTSVKHWIASACS